MKILVSACLLGYNCKYSGGNNYHQGVISLEENFEIIPICPEVFGGLPIPRKPSERIGEKVLTASGDDFTKNFQEGAEISLEIALKNDCKYAVLKAKSPSCGCGLIYDGTYSGVTKEGNGVTSDLLIKHGIKIFNENNFCELLNKVRK